MILHAVGVNGTADGGLFYQIARKYPEVLDLYKSYIKLDRGLATDILGGSVVIPIGDKLFISMLFCISTRGGKNILEYSALSSCLRDMKANAYFGAVCSAGGTVHVPYKMGAGVDAGDWSVISKIVDRQIPEAVICVLPRATTPRAAQ